MFERHICSPYHPSPPQTKYKNMKTHEEKMKVVHAIWLAAWDNEKVEVIIDRAAKILRINPETLFEDFDDDYADRAWCSRPINWKATDSIA